ncbi:MAG TPA: shikimate kinase [Chitinophagaceae bacterium]|nr:shikimate kinase [Chitinophagaceae bacterium]
MVKIFLLGFMGAGKSHWGRKLSSQLNRPLFDLDQEIAAVEKMEVSEIFRIWGEAHFRECERMLLHRLSAKPEFILACGGGTPCFFDNMTFMNATGKTIWLNPSVERIIGRLQVRKYRRPLIADLSDDALLAYVSQKLGERSPYYGQAQYKIDPDRISVTAFVETILHE